MANGLDRNSASPHLQEVRRAVRYHGAGIVLRRSGEAAGIQRTEIRGLTSMSQPDDFGGLPPDPRPRRARKPVFAVVAVLGGAAVMVLAVCGGVVAVLWMREIPDQQPAVILVEPSPAVSQSVIDRDVFTRQVVGLNLDGVRNLAGQPSSIQENEPITWHYAGRTRDTATGHIDGDAIVIFENGRAKEVSFAPAEVQRQPQPAEGWTTAHDHVAIMRPHLCVLIRKQHELGIEPVFWKEEAKGELAALAV
jgi:hypothetical protein